MGALSVSTTLKNVVGIDSTRGDCRLYIPILPVYFWLEGLFYIIPRLAPCPEAEAVS